MPTYVVLQPVVMNGATYMAQPMVMHRAACSPYTSHGSYTMSKGKRSAPGEAVASTRVHGWEMDMDKVLLERGRRWRRNPCNANLRRVSRCTGRALASMASLIIPPNRAAVPKPIDSKKKQNSCCC